MWKFCAQLRVTMPLGSKVYGVLFLMSFQNMKPFGGNIMISVFLSKHNHQAAPHSGKSIMVFTKQHKKLGNRSSIKKEKKRNRNKAIG